MKAVADAAAEVFRLQCLRQMMMTQPLMMLATGEREREREAEKVREKVAVAGN